MGAHKLHIAGRPVRLHGSLHSPDFRMPRVLCSDPWDFVSLWLKRSHQRDASIYWGIVGFDRYAYKYDSGHSGESALVGFASRKPDLAIYLDDWPGRPALLAKLGKHKMGKACLSVRRLANVDLAVLEQLIVESVRETRRRWPG